MRTILLATGNPDKARELKTMLGADFEVKTMKDFGIDIDIIEDGQTYEANALIKVRALQPLVKGKDLIIMGDDSGLSVDCLNGAPGIYSARYAGEEATYADNNKKLLKEMADVPEMNRGAAFITVIAMILPDGRELCCEGLVRGKIAFDYCGVGGFGYDPLFIHEASGRCYGDMTKAEKNRLSHRAVAIAKARELLNQAL
ncbi:RdgB/HAM1 family non-canonical purine NTP pyrophosphatase [Acetobacterium carbinolicum]|jgi:XTP/dITP diphosphohydrolase|uniref:RdgB/HAM1 family non-canonical purine NTP pyrophosphatase n=1 Tax=Acetobacterium TaxID=33951 RepID=UPI0019551497|nr:MULTISPECIES: RdgB/HAM1 family non-canonical purine NTP pyrophosphatase [unclassified Acetobacterium]MDZ5724247.1 RdgB/HAM1 family non-canonical purine NTP pyrophosphatase [Acetobacterium sp. K1/6]